MSLGAVSASVASIGGIRGPAFPGSRDIPSIPKSVGRQCSLTPRARREIRRTKGLGEAMKWRDAQFAPFEGARGGVAS